LIDEHLPIVTSELSREMLRRVSDMSIDEYLDLFLDRGYQAFLVDKESSNLIPLGDARDFLAAWTDVFRIEDLLFLPPGTSVE
jgi:hypothetical protein